VHFADKSTSSGVIIHILNHDHLWNGDSIQMSPTIGSIELATSFPWRRCSTDPESCRKSNHRWQLWEPAAKARFTEAFISQTDVKGLIAFAIEQLSIKRSALSACAETGSCIEFIALIERWYFDEFARCFLTKLDPGPIADQHQFVVYQAGANFDLIRGLEAQRHVSFFETMISI
jgi:hypothetical protein